MKYLLALAPLTALLFSAGCSQSPEKLLATANKYHQNKKYKEASILYQKVIAKDKTNAEAYYREGLNLLDEHQPGQASGYLRRAVDLKPDNADAATKLAEIYLTVYASDPHKYRNLLDEARDLNTKVLTREPNSYAGLRLAGLVALADKDSAKALEEFGKANQLKPYSRDLVGWYAETLLASKSPDQAMTLVKDMLAHDKSWGPGYDFLFLQYNRSGELAKAEATLRDRVANDPSSEAAYVNLSNYLLTTNRFAEAEQVMRKLLDNKKAFPNAHQVMGDLYVRAKKYDQALEQYKAGLTENPKATVGYQERIIAVNEIIGRHDEALKLAKELAAKNPKDTSANEVYASLLLQRGTASDLGKSITDLKDLVARNPTNAILHMDLARGYAGLNDRDNALSEALEATRRDARLMPPRLLAARIYEDRGDHSKAIDQSEVVLNAEPGNPEARLIRARAWIRSGRIDKGQAELESLLASYPKLNEARLQLASIYLAQRSYDKASAEFDKTWKSDPPEIRGFVGEQTVKMAQGKTEEALGAMQKMLQQDPKNELVRYQLANFQSTAFSIKEKSNPSQAKELANAAIDNFKELLKTSPKSDDIWIRLGILQRETDQFDAALGSFEEAAKANPRSANAYLNQAMLQEALGKKKDASDSYNRVLGIEPRSTLALNNLAFLNAESGTNLDQAMTMAIQAKKQVPNSADVSDTLGYVYYQKNLNSEALQIFRQLVDQSPQNPTFHFHLAMALLKQGDKQGARTEAEKALKEAPPQQQDKIKSFVGQIG